MEFPIHIVIENHTSSNITFNLRQIFYFGHVNLENSTPLIEAGSQYEFDAGLCDGSDYIDAMRRYCRNNEIIFNPSTGIWVTVTDNEPL